MTVETFWRYCFNFAMKRSGAKKEVSEDFAQQAWIYKYKNGWHATLFQMWKSFVRDDLKRAGSFSIKSYKLKYKAPTTIGPVNGGAGKNIDYIENFIAAPDNEQWGAFLISNLSLREKIFIFLLEAGWSRSDLLKAYPEVNFENLWRTIQKKLASEDESKALLGSTIEKIGSERVRLEVIRERNSAPVDLTSVDFSSF